MTPLDKLIVTAESALRTLSGGASAARTCPRPDVSPAQLARSEQRLSGALMRVNHVGEVCAQALYSAQGLTTRDPELKRQFAHAAREETDHLAWTEKRLDELNARTSVLNPLWYAGAFAIGLLAGRIGDATSLGFVVETERQVEAHLADHLKRLPQSDLASRAIVIQMQADEAAHAASAESAGAAPLPAPARWAMRLAARVMTSTAHYL